MLIDNKKPVAGIYPSHRSSNPAKSLVTTTCSTVCKKNSCLY